MNFQFIIEYIYQLFLLSPYLFTSVVLVRCVYFSCRNNESHELDLSKSLWGIPIITLLTLMEFFIPGIWDLKISHNVITLFLTIDLVLICLVTIFHNSSESKKETSLFTFYSCSTNLFNPIEYYCFLHYHRWDDVENQYYWRFIRII